MAKMVELKMPFESLRGKLATKQKGITYSGQVGDSAFFTPDGKRLSTNYNKCIVINKRRGIQRFYVKSYAGINLSRRQRISQLYAAMANEILINAIVDAAILQQLQACYHEDTRGYFSIEDFVRAELISSLRAGGQELTVYARDEYGIRIPAAEVSLGDNPLNMSGLTCEVAGLSTMTDRMAAIVNKFYTALRSEHLTNNRAFVPVSYNGKIYRVPTGAGIEDIESLDFDFAYLTRSEGNSTGELNSISSHLLGIFTENNVSAGSYIHVKIYDNASGKYIAGGENFVMYRDAEKTMPVTNDVKVSEEAVFYV